MKFNSYEDFENFLDNLGIERELIGHNNLTLHEQVVYKRGVKIFGQKTEYTGFTIHLEIFNDEKQVSFCFFGEFDLEELSLDRDIYLPDFNSYMRDVDFLHSLVIEFFDKFSYELP